VPFSEVPLLQVAGLDGGIPGSQLRLAASFGLAILVLSFMVEGQSVVPVYFNLPDKASKPCRGWASQP